MREYTEYHWEETKLYYGNDFCFEIIPHEQYPTLWWLVKPDGEKVDFYNIQRAKDNARKIDQFEYNRECRRRSQVEPLVSLND